MGCILTIALSRFIASNKRSQVLPHMPQEKRKFVYSVSISFRMSLSMTSHVYLARGNIPTGCANGRPGASPERSSRSTT
jgi:hypothetical protein